MELDIEKLTLSNAAGGCLEQQFQDALKRIVAASENSEDFETSKKGELKFEITARLVIELNPSAGSAWIEGQVTDKGPKRRSRKQVARLNEDHLIVDVEPLPEQIVLRMGNRKGA